MGLTKQLAEALTDRRHVGYVGHTFLEMVRMRTYGILADYADQNDHDLLRSDPVFKLVCGRSIHDDDLASQPTLSRFENAIDTRPFFHLRDVLVDQFIASFDKPPQALTLDIDPFDDPTYGGQQLTFFHGYYRQYQYLPRVITCAENDLVLCLALLYGSHSALGADEDLEYAVRRLREAWPDVRIRVRGDSGFGVPAMYDICERLEVDYTIGIGMNGRLKKYSDSLLGTAVAQFEASGQPQRLFTAFWYRAGSWPAQRWVVVKCEANAQGTNRRAVVTNRPGAFVLPGSAYDAYADRGKARTATKNSRAAFRPIGSAIIATSPTCFASICTRPPTTCWSACGTLSRRRYRKTRGAKFRSKRSPADLAGRITTDDARTIRSAKASPVLGGRGLSK